MATTKRKQTRAEVAWRMIKARMGREGYGRLHADGSVTWSAWEIEESAKYVVVRLLAECDRLRRTVDALNSPDEGMRAVFAGVLRRHGYVVTRTAAEVRDEMAGAR